ncbi:hypothetical protein KSP39_PZI008011 [Platanthera zijinensis]|uniref:Uncharacterized protein n=1 Tax=Platanthera zijinensis TaxID=2320716 RepID=A0AAP0G971_9ASPA
MLRLQAFCAHCCCLILPDILWMAPIMEKLSLTAENYGSVRRYFIRTIDDDRMLSPDVHEKLVRHSACYHQMSRRNWSGIIRLTRYSSSKAATNQVVDDCM